MIKKYECYSYKQNYYLKEMGFEPISIDVHHVTGRRFWVYEMDDMLSLALKAWTFHANKIRK